MLVVIAVAAFVVVFSLISSKTLISQYNYQNRVINAKRVTYNQLKIDVNNATSLEASYESFENQPLNILGQSPSGSSQNSGDNAKIILDALPSQYDFPGFVSSIGNLLSSQNYVINSVTGTDLGSSEPSSLSSGQSTPVQIPFEISVTGTYTTVQQLISTLQLSIRPIVIQQVDLSGTDAALEADITAYTYYQPGVNFSLGTEVVK
jgi:Tfp pilus assembly protein PilO